MLFSKKAPQNISAPVAKILNLGGDEYSEIIKFDIGFLTRLFGEVRHLEWSVPGCDVLFPYAQLTVDGAIQDSSRGLREIVRDSGAKIVVVASPNPSGHYIKAGKQQPYGRANLVMILDRRGEVFSRFFVELFSKMLRGYSMPAAWSEISPQIPGGQRPGCPEAIFACEIGAVTFR